MSDINIIPDGLVAFIVAAALSLLLLSGLIVCLINGAGKARRASRPLRHQTVFPHIAGILVSLASFVIIMLFLLSTEWMPRPHTLNRWLDNRVWLWATVLLSLWPLTAYTWRHQR